MKFFLYSDEGALLSLARLLQPKHDVLLYIKEGYAAQIGDGLVPKTDNPNPPTGSTVIFDMGNHGRQGASLRERGFAVIGGNPAEKSLEDDRFAGQALMEEYDVCEIPETEEFTSFSDARKFIGGMGGHWFLKVCGTAGDGSTSDAEAEEMLRYLDWLEESGFKAEKFQLQRKVEGTEFDIEGWFDGHQFIPGMVVSTLEEKRLMAGDVGPQTGSESSLLWLGDDAFFARTLGRLSPYLAEQGYVGPVALNLIIDKKGAAYGLEFTARLGWHESHANFYLLGDSVGEQLDEFARGNLPRFECKQERVMLLNISVPPYPYFWKQEAEKRRGFPLDDDMLNDPRITPEDVLLNDDGQPGMGGRNGNLGTIRSVKDTLKGMRAEVLEVAHDLHIPQLQYRIDPVHRAEDDLAELERLGVVSVKVLAQRPEGKVADARPFNPPRTLFK